MFQIRIVSGQPTCVGLTHLYDIYADPLSDILICIFDTGLTGLTHLDLFCAKITDNGTNYLRSKLFT